MSIVDRAFRNHIATKIKLMILDISFWACSCVDRLLCQEEMRDIDAHVNFVDDAIEHIMNNVVPFERKK
jgi:hypothetical protein